MVEKDVCRYGDRAPCHEGSVGKTLRPSDRRWAAEYLTRVWSLCISRACGLVDLARGAWYRGDTAENQAMADAPVIDALNDIIEDNARWGFWKCLGTSGGAGWEYVHVAIDDCSRIAHSKIQDSETADAAVDHLLAAVRYCRSLGVTIRRTRSNNGCCCRWKKFAAMCRCLGIPERFTRPYTSPDQ